MLDGTPPTTLTVWGIKVPVRDNGRKNWPAELRTLAVKRIAAGAGIREIADEIGANKSLVSVWVKNANADVADGAPAFVELLPPDSSEHSKPITARQVSPPQDLLACRIRLGDADITIPPDFPPDRLVGILRAVRSAQ